MKKKINQKNINLEINILNYAKMNKEDILQELNSNMKGLDEETVLEKIKEYGYNEINYGKSQPWFVRFILSFVNPFNMVLFLVAIVSFFTEVLFSNNKSWATVIIIVVLISISGILQYVQEAKSDKAALKLKEMVSSNTAIIRGSKLNEYPMKEVVIGDIIKLSAGDMMPADLRILYAKDLFIGQAALTGESEPIEKFQELKKDNISALEASNICFMGTNVVSGSAIAVVIGTGNNTYFGSIAKDLTGRKAQTSFEKGIASVSKLLLRLMFVMVPIIFITNGILKQDWINALLFALAVAVGITPELLPMIMTSTLAKGAVMMSKQKTIVKNLSSIQSFGAMDVLCTDKTGTLTEDKIVLEKYLDIHGQDDLRVLKHAYLNSYFQTGLKNMMDLAIIARADKEGYTKFNEIYRKVDEIPYDFQRRRMSVVLEDNNGKRQLITKGAVEEMLKCCRYIDYNGQVTEITSEVIKEVLKISERLNEQGLRALAVAQKNRVRDTTSFNADDESDMVLIGYVAFLDQPKESSKLAINALHDNGVRVIVLTGDNEKVASAVCKQVNLETNGYILGSDVEKLTDEELNEKVKSINLFAKLSPSQKVRVVQSLQGLGHVVGYMGDGINDAPALTQADVGISVDTAVDIAKESADIILLEKSLMVLEEGVIEGRKTFGNIVKYIKMASSGNFGNMFSVLAASIFLPFLPMLPLQILAQNMLYDFSQIAIPFDKMDNEYLKKPQQWDPKGIQRFMFIFGILSSLFDILTFIILYYGFKANSIENQAIFQTGWFMVGLLSQIFIVHLIRTAKIPFIESRASKPLIISTIIIGLVGIIIPFTRIGIALDMVRMPLTFIPVLFGIIFSYAIVVQFVKKFYIKKYGHLI